MIADLHLQTKLRDGITHLKKVYATPPFKIADVREDKREKTLKLMVMSSSPGILDGDKYRIKIELDEGCSLQVLTQSYQRLFDMKTGAAQNMEVNMAYGTAFCYLPHPAVPHQNSAFTSKNKLFMAASCQLIWGEVLTCGRKLNGEVFLFSRYHNLTEIYFNGKLVIKENLLIRPGQINLNAIGQLENYTHQASLIYLEENVMIKPIKQSIMTYLCMLPKITFGITETPKNGLMVRILGYKAEQLHNCLITMAGLVQEAKLKKVHFKTHPIEKGS